VIEKVYERPTYLVMSCAAAATPSGPSVKGQVGAVLSVLPVAPVAAAAAAPSAAPAGVGLTDSGARLVRKCCSTCRRGMGNKVLPHTALLLLLLLVSVLVRLY
jgi:hypothetical protein